jgi:hypothetical protein
MTFSDFCERILIALYQDGNTSDEWLSLADLQRKYGLAGDPSWLSRAMTYLRAQRRVDGREIVGAPDSVVARITGSGMAYIESKYGSHDGVGTILEPVLPDLAPEQEAPRQITISAAWTGRALNSEQVEELGRNIDDAIRRVDDLSLGNDRKAQCRAYLRGARELVQAPEPPFDLIAYLLANVDRIIGIAGFVIGVVGLLVSVGI